jgi:hypothetical protein
MKYLLTFYLLLFSSLSIASASENTESTPKPPQLPKYFQWEGRYIVKDLNVNVPFTWHGDGDNMQMIAGSHHHRDPIHFTNLIYNDRLYTQTYKWVELGDPPVDPSEPHLCSCVGKFTTEKLNACLAESRLVGPEILLKKKPHALHVNHFRVTIPPFIEGDFYTDVKDNEKLWQVLHFGLQNLYDPALDEWIEIEKFNHKPGKVVLPQECEALTPIQLALCDANDLVPVCR